MGNKEGVYSNFMNIVQILECHMTCFSNKERFLLIAP